MCKHMWTILIMNLSEIEIIVQVYNGFKKKYKEKVYYYFLFAVYAKNLWESIEKEHSTV